MNLAIRLIQKIKQQPSASTEVPSSLGLVTNSNDLGVKALYNTGWANQVLLRMVDQWDSSQPQIPTQDAPSRSELAIHGANESVASIMDENSSEETHLHFDIHEAEEDAIFEVFDLSDPSLDNSSVIGSMEPKKKKKKKKKDKTLITINPTQLSKFHQWLLDQKPLNDGNLKKKIRKVSKIEQTVQESIRKSDKIASEPLAKILAAQGHIGDAIEMYLQLSLNIPEKSSYFAARIEELKNRL